MVAGSVDKRRQGDLGLACTECDWFAEVSLPANVGEVGAREPGLGAELLLEEWEVMLFSSLS